MFAIGCGWRQHGNRDSFDDASPGTRGRDWCLRLHLWAVQPQVRLIDAGGDTLLEQSSQLSNPGRKVSGPLLGLDCLAAEAPVAASWFWRRIGRWPAHRVVHAALSGSDSDRLYPNPSAIGRSGQTDDHHAPTAPPPLGGAPSAFARRPGRQSLACARAVRPLPYVGAWTFRTTVAFATATLERRLLHLTVSR